MLKNLAFALKLFSEAALKITLIFVQVHGWGQPFTEKTAKKLAVGKLVNFF